MCLVFTPHRYKTSTENQTIQGKKVYTINISFFDLKQMQHIVCTNVLIYFVFIQSSNGTIVNKQKIPPEVPYVLNDGDEVALGDIETVKEEYQCFKVGKMTSFDIISLDTSDDEEEVGLFYEFFCLQYSYACV